MLRTSVYHAHMLVNALYASVRVWDEQFGVYNLLYREDNAILDSEANGCPISKHYKHENHITNLLFTDPEFSTALLAYSTYWVKYVQLQPSHCITNDAHLEDTPIR